MLYALMDGIKVRAQPHERASCPNCGSEVLAKCGAINIWHWAHLPSIDCDSWSEGETDWHLLWKSYFPPESVEVSILKDRKRHVADIIARNKTIIELQASSISVEEMKEREEFYGRMAWVFDVAKVMIGHHLNIRQKGNYQTFRWYYPRNHIAYTSKPTWLDLGDSMLFQLKAMHPFAPCGGWGYLRDKGAVISSWGGTVGS